MFTLLSEAAINLIVSNSWHVRSCTWKMHTPAHVQTLDWLIRRETFRAVFSCTVREWMTLQIPNSKVASTGCVCLCVT
jgi:hypothetical protein